MTLHSIQHGAPSDTVLIHGAGGNSNLWSGVLSGLSGQGTARAVDLPGHPDGPITCSSIDQYAESVHEFIAQDRRGAPVVAGHSMGGAIALTLALSHPEDIRALVLIGTGAKLGVLPETISGLERSALDTVEKLITPMSFYGLDLETARNARAALSLSNPAVFLNDYLACKGFDRRTDVARLSVPTLIVCGDRDRMTPPKWSHFLHSSIIGSLVYFISECGHMAPLEKPRPLAALFQEFLLSLNR